MTITPTSYSIVGGVTQRAAAPEVEARTPAAGPVTQNPTDIPLYATACGGSIGYASACSCAGITQVTTYAPTPVCYPPPLKQSKYRLSLTSHSGYCHLNSLRCNLCDPWYVYPPYSSPPPLRNPNPQNSQNPHQIKLNPSLQLATPPSHTARRGMMAKWTQPPDVKTSPASTRILTPNNVAPSATNMAPTVSRGTWQVDVISWLSQREARRRLITVLLDSMRLQIRMLVRAGMGLDRVCIRLIL